jgi:hypothetical protein
MGLRIERPDDVHGLFHGLRKSRAAQGVRSRGKEVGAICCQARQSSVTHPRKTPRKSLHPVWQTAFGYPTSAHGDRARLFWQHDQLDRKLQRPALSIPSAGDSRRQLRGTIGALKVSEPQDGARPRDPIFAEGGWCSPIPELDCEPLQKSAQLSRNAIEAAAKPHARLVHRPLPCDHGGHWGAARWHDLVTRFSSRGILRIRPVWLLGRHRSPKGEAINPLSQIEGATPAR